MESMAMKAEKETVHADDDQLTLRFLITCPFVTTCLIFL